MARKRINRAAICTSDNYTISRAVHIKMLQENHNTIISIKSLTAVKIPYVKAWGKLIKITVEEANNLPTSLVIWQ